MNILVIEDNHHDFEFLSEILGNITTDCILMGPITTVKQGKEFFRTNKERVDIIFADIQLNDGLSFSALTEAPEDIPVIFTTSSEEYALKAFEFNSLSYLLKPLDEKELHTAIVKTQQRLITNEHREELAQILAGHAHFRERLIVNTYKGEKVIPLSKVKYFVSEQKSTFARLFDGTSFDVNLSLGALEEELNPRHFMRVNRKFIVPIQEIEGFESISGGREKLILHGEDTPEIIISRDSKKKIHNWLIDE